MSTTLRAALIEDSRDAAEVLLSSRKEFLPFAPIAHSEAEVHQWVREVLIPSGEVTVASVGSRVVGVLAVTRETGISWIDQLYVAPGYTGRGVGSLLLRHALSVLEFPIRLYTFQANGRARMFYERHGFAAIVFSDGSANEEGCPDVLYELARSADRAR